MDDCIGRAAQVVIILWCTDCYIICAQITSGNANDNKDQPKFYVLYHRLFVPILDLGQIKAFDKESYI